MSELKSHILRSSILVVSLVILTFSLSYAYFSASVTDVNPDRDLSTVTTGNLKIDFQSTQTINNENAMLIKDTDVQSKADHTDFTVSHQKDSNQTGYYFVYLTEVSIDDALKSEDFKWKLVKVGDNSEEEIANGNFQNAENGQLMTLTPSAQELPLSETHNLKLYIWLSETDQDQSAFYNKQFSAKVQVVASV